MDAGNDHSHHVSAGWLFQGHATEGRRIWTGEEIKNKNRGKEGMCLTRQESETTIIHEILC